MKNLDQSIIGLKELRENVEFYVKAAQKGRSFIVVRKSKPVFRISSPLDADELWETAVDLTKIKKGGVGLSEILARL
jgi:prevent-host-death family protein